MCVTKVGIFLTKYLTYVKWSDGEQTNLQLRTTRFVPFTEQCFYHNVKKDAALTTEAQSQLYFVRMLHVSLRHRVQIGPWSRPASYPMDIGGSFPRDKTAGAWIWALASIYGRSSWTSSWWCLGTETTFTFHVYWPICAHLMTLSQVCKLHCVGWGRRRIRNWKGRVTKW